MDKEISTIIISGKEIDKEGYFKTVVFWTKKDGSIKMDVGYGFGKDNLKELLQVALKCIEEEDYELQ